MSRKRRVLTNGKLPDAQCPHCGAQVVKAVQYGQLSYVCTKCSRWGPWEQRRR